MISYLSLRLSASCVHVPVLLHALVAMKPGMSSCLSGEDDSDNDIAPVTLLPCQ